MGSYLIDTGAGLILIDTTIFETVYLVLEAIYDLGYQPRDIRHILLTHCHVDHSGGVNQIRAISGATVWQSKEDTEFMRRRANLELGDDFKIVDYTVDQFYDDHEPIRLGNVEIRTLLTPGHTPGTTSFFITVPDDKGGTLVVGLHGGVGTNTMTDTYYQKFGEDRSLRKRFIEDCDRLKSIHVDITISGHPAQGNLMGRLGDDLMDYTPLIDPEMWPQFLGKWKQHAEDLEYMSKEH